MAETRRKPLLLPAALAATVLLCAVIGWMIQSRAAILRDGQEVVLRTAPIDPRDLLRGHFVILQYEGQAVTIPDFAAMFPEMLDAGSVGNRHYTATPPGPVYVVLRQDEEGYHVPDQVMRQPPEEGLFIRGHAASGAVYRPEDGSATMTVHYGIERFYIDEHRAPEIEARMREGAVTEVVAAVSEAGVAQIKVLRQDGEVFATEPLY